jgi:hypothetical protein
LARSGPTEHWVGGCNLSRLEVGDGVFSSVLDVGGPRDYGSGGEVLLRRRCVRRVCCRNPPGSVGVVRLQG